MIQVNLPDGSQRQLDDGASAAELAFEKAAALRDEIRELKGLLVELGGKA